MGYPLLPFLMNIIQGENLIAEEKLYNQLVSTARSLVERTIGLLKIRFRCILGERTLRYAPTKASQIIITCATLHNYLVFNGFDLMRNIDEDILRVQINNDREFNNNNNNNAHNVNRDGGLQRRGAILGWIHEQP